MFSPVQEESKRPRKSLTLNNQQRVDTPEQETQLQGFSGFVRKAARFTHSPDQLPTLQSLAERLAKHARKEKQSLIEATLPEYEESGARDIEVVEYDALQDE